MLDIVRETPTLLVEEGRILSHPYVIINNGIGFLCGCIKVYEDHPWYESNIDQLQHLQVHGGITYSGKDADDEGWWVGFDCCHALDAPLPTLGITNVSQHFNQAYRYIRTPAYVRQELIRLIMQMNLLCNHSRLT